MNIARINNIKYINLSKKQSNNSNPFANSNKTKRVISLNDNLFAQSNKSDIAFCRIFKTKQKRHKIKTIKSEIGKNTIKNKEYKKILPYFGIEVEENENKMLTLSEYHQPSDDISFSNIGIDENDLFNHIEEIKGDADFRNSQMISLGSLKSIGGKAIFLNCKIRSFGKLETIESLPYYTWCQNMCE